MIRLKKLAGLLKEDVGDPIDHSIQDSIKTMSEDIFDGFHDLQDQAKKLIGKKADEVLNSFQSGALSYLRIDLDRMGYGSEEDAAMKDLSEMGVIKKTDVSISMETFGNSNEIEVVVKLFTASRDIIEIQLGDSIITW